jgi:hypothetical protein
VTEKRISNDEEMPSHSMDVLLTKYGIPDGTEYVVFTRFYSIIISFSRLRLHSLCMAEGGQVKFGGDPKFF